MSQSDTPTPNERPTDEAGQETIGAAHPGRPDELERDPDEWATGDEPMTDAQRSYLETLAREAGEQLPAAMTKAEASKQIDRLQKGNDRLT